jgi:protein gp37
VAKQGEHGISWTDETWNPIRGCSRVSEGCRNCYAEALAARFSNLGQPYQGLAIMRSDGPHWTGEVAFADRHLEDPIRWRNPRRVFVNSMSDLFHEKVEEEWIEEIFAVMAVAKRHTFQILTKRPERMRQFCDDTTDEGIQRWACIEGRAQRLYAKLHPKEKDVDLWLAVHSPLENVWLGVSVEDQKTADERIPLLLETQAAVRWVSYEPALGPVSIPYFLRTVSTAYAHLPSLDWLVCGGESGPNARPMHPNWARSVRDQCASASVPFHFKQWGEWVAPEQCPCALHSSGAHDYVSDGREHSPGCPNQKQCVVRVGKRLAGDRLDGRRHQDFPK